MMHPLQSKLLMYATKAMNIISHTTLAAARDFAQIPTEQNLFRHVSHCGNLSSPSLSLSTKTVHGEANLSQTAQKREKNNVIIFLVPIRDMVERDAVTKLHGIISMYINVTAIQSRILPLASMEEKKNFIAALCHGKTLIGL